MEGEKKKKNSPSLGVGTSYASQDITLRILLPLGFKASLGLLALLREQFSATFRSIFHTNNDKNNQPKPFTDQKQKYKTERNVQT
jgi:hypothetical protein